MVRPVDTKVLSSIVNESIALGASTADLPAVLLCDLRNYSNRQQGSQPYLACPIAVALTVIATNTLRPTFTKSLLAGKSTTASVVHLQCARSTTLSAQPLLLRLWLKKVQKKGTRFNKDSYTALLFIIKGMCWEKGGVCSVVFNGVSSS